MHWIILLITFISHRIFLIDFNFLLYAITFDILSLHFVLFYFVFNPPNFQIRDEKKKAEPVKQIVAAKKTKSQVKKRKYLDYAIFFCSNYFAR